MHCLINKNTRTMIWLHIWNHSTFHKDSMNIRIWCIHLSADTFTPRKFWKECFWWDEARAGSLARFTWKCEWHRLWGSPSLISSQTRVVPSIFWQGPFYGQNSILVYIQPVKIRSAVLCKSKKKKIQGILPFWSFLFVSREPFVWIGGMF